MTKHTAEQVDRIVTDIRSRAILVGEKAEILLMLRSYAELLRERELEAAHQAECRRFQSLMDDVHDD